MDYQRIDECLKSVFGLAFRMRVTVIFFAADRFLLLHPDASKLVYDPFNSPRLLPRQY